VGPLRGCDYFEAGDIESWTHCGSIGQEYHLPAIARNPSVNLLAVADVDDDVSKAPISVPLLWHLEINDRQYARCLCHLIAGSKHYDCIFTVLGTVFVATNVI
jgi:hypothetical protein